MHFRLSTSLALQLLFSLTVVAQDCSEFNFSTTYRSFPSGEDIHLQLIDECPDPLLLVTYTDGGAIKTTEEIVIPRVSASAFISVMDRIDTDKLHSLHNPYLADGRMVEYSYTSRQGYTTEGILHLPPASLEGLLSLEDELRAQVQFYRLYRNYLPEVYSEVLDRLVVPVLRLYE